MKIVFLLVESVDLDDVRVSTKDVKDFRFFLKAVTVGGIGKEAFVDRLTGKGVAGDFGVTPVDGSEATSADLFADLIIVV